MSSFFDMMSAALYAIVVQNLIFSGGYGISEAVRMAAKPRRLASAAGMIVWFSTITSVICRLLDFNEKVASQNSSIHFLIFVGVLIFVYLITCIFTVILLRPNKKLMSNFGIAALNTLVLAIPLINYRSAMTLWESIGTGFGSGIAFVLASLLIGAGFTKLSKEKRIPKAFRGAPVMFIYVAMLSLTFMGISGSGVFA
ncbi:MAG: hypothetical protein MJ147_06545 [Clostridia bacterium]|nr:hypothetical protein [Clostridia bacterium]